MQMPRLAMKVDCTAISQGDEQVEGAEETFEDQTADLHTDAVGQILRLT